MYSSARAVLCTASFFLLYVSPLCGDTADFNDVVRTVIRNVDRNYSHIKSARGELLYMKSDSPGTRRSIEQPLLDQEVNSAAGDQQRGVDGSSLSFSMPPSIFPSSIPPSSPIPTTLSISPLKDQYGPFTHRFAILGPDIRVNVFTGYAQIVSIVKGEKLAIYDPASNNIRIRDRHTKTRRWRDPRNVFRDESQRFTEFLAEQEAGAVRWTESDQGKLLNLQFDTDGGDRVFLSLDPALSYLPVFVAEVHRSHLNSTTEITYQELKVDDGSAWFPSTLTFKSWAKATPVTEKAEIGWNQKFEYAIENLKLTSDIDPSEFTLEIPEGTFIDNAIDGSNFYTDVNLSLP